MLATQESVCRLHEMGSAEKQSHKKGKAGHPRVLARPGTLSHRLVRWSLE